MKVSLQRQGTFVKSGRGYFIARHLYVILLFSPSYRTQEVLQTEKQVSDSGEESFHYRTMVGRIFTITVTKARCEHVILELFNVSESRDQRYGMPTMRASPEERYQVVPPSVSRNYLPIQCRR